MKPTEPEQSREKDARYLLRCRLVKEQRRRLDLERFACTVNPRFQWYRHLQVLGRCLERVAAGELKRLMVFMPPRHGKSELVSRIFPAYYLFRHPDRWVGITSYSADLAQAFSRNARAHYESLGRRLRRSAAALRHWETRAGGGFWSAGVGGTITGKGFHLGIIDDPLKNAAQASSPTIRSRQKDWYRSTFYTRQEPGAAIILIMTRWDEDDLAGWLLGQEKSRRDCEGWHLVNFPALAEPGVWSPPASCSMEPDWRRPGQALCPERYPARRLERTMARVGRYYAQALYQQRPLSSIGKGRVYRAFDRGRNVAPVEDSGGELLIGMDFNVDPMSAVVCLRAGEQLHQVDEIELMDSGTAEMAAEIKRRYPGRPVTVYPDPSGRSRRTSAPVGRTDFTILRRAGFRVVAPSSAPAVVDRVNQVNLLCGEGGQPARYFVHPRCQKTITALERLTFKPGSNQPDKGKGYDHLTDALGYLVHGEFPVAERLHRVRLLGV